MQPLRTTTCIVGVILLIASGVAAAASATPQEVTALAQSGATQLALKLVDAGESASRDDSDAWARWERVRIDIYQREGNWRAVVRRVAALSRQAPDELRAWALLQSAEAHLALGEGAAARRNLRARLSAFGTAQDQATRQQIDRLMIRSQILDGRFEDGAGEIAAYRARYPKAAADIIPLQARVALLQRHPAQAWQVLAPVTDGDVLPLKWLAALRTGELAPAAVRQRAGALAKDDKQAPALRRQALLVAAEAAQDMREPAARIGLLERAVAIPATLAESRPPFAATAETVWRALEGLGQTLGNDRQLVIGDDAARLALAAGAADKPIEAQALLAVVAWHGFDAATRADAQSKLAQLLAQQPAGAALLDALYLHSRRFKTIEQIPAPARQRLAAAAYASRNMALAAKLWANLDTPPAGAEAAKWQLERARGLILGGRADAGVAVLTQVMGAGASFDVQQILPALFALQAVGRDRDALRFFYQLLALKPPPPIRQKLLYWVADSYAALGNQVAAARLYLQSATAIDPTAMDPWAQTARYHAAGALARAGLTADARRIYRRLLGATSDPARQAALREQIAHLPLAAARPGGQ